ncbi:single-stranded DNA-binding protein [Candidatus Uhrbacteria bacterium]|nr:single-stranded DNA-binding protein [Candidatus Uhrbacteria bacterium]
MDLNKVMLIGRLTKNPELRSTPNGQSVTSFTIATNRTFTDNAGQKQEKAEFHNVVAWAKLAEIISTYLAKGRRAYIEGRLQTRDWVAQDGTRRYSTEIVAENMIMLDGPSGKSNTPVQQMDHGTDTPPNAQSSDEERTLEEIPF